MDGEDEHDDTCPGMWLLEAVAIGDSGSVSTYRCELCDHEIEVPPAVRPTTC